MSEFVGKNVIAGIVGGVLVMVPFTMFLDYQIHWPTLFMTLAFCAVTDGVKALLDKPAKRSDDRT